MTDTPGGPGGFTLSWAQLISSVMALPGMAIFGGALWRAWAWYWDRIDRSRGEKKQESTSIEEQLRAARAVTEQRLDARTDKLLDIKDKMLADAERELARVERDRDRGWALARHWYWLYRDLVPSLRQAIMVASSASRRLRDAKLITEADMPSFEAPPAIMPDLEDPIPRSP